VHKQKKNDDGLDEKRVLFFSLCTFLTIYAIFMAAVAYCKMNNICEEGEANGGVLWVIPLSRYSEATPNGISCFMKASFSHKQSLKHQKKTFFLSSI
jgi:hypothetical protein